MCIALVNTHTHAHIHIHIHVWYTHTYTYTYGLHNTHTLSFFSLCVWQVLVRVWQWHCGRRPCPGLHPSSIQLWHEPHEAGHPTGVCGDNALACVYWTVYSRVLYVCVCVWCVSVCVCVCVCVSGWWVSEALWRWLSKYACGAST
jgi:hypothetical protein